jgi:hypothetical protein
MENSVSKANEKAQQFSGYLELKEYQRQTISIWQRCVRFGTDRIWEKLNL